MTEPGMTRHSWSKWVICLGIACVLLSVAGSKFDSPKHTRLRQPEKIRKIQDLTYSPGVPIVEKNRTQIGEEKATLFMLVRNYEVQDALDTIRQIEDRFNRQFRYPWTFLNDEDFTDEFKSLTSGLVSGGVEYGKVPVEHWSIPDHINQTLMRERMAAMEDNQVVYGGSMSYRLMCRFNSGFFFRHPLMEKYDWYWRTEPGVKYYCDQRYDPFAFMKNNGKVYGFVIALYEYIETIPTLWDTAASFFQANSEYIAEHNALDFVTDQTQLRMGDLIMESTGDYNLCHFWSNFEIADLRFFRTEAYLKYFEHLDEAGGFFYERWGDAPVHTIALTALLNRTQIHHFADIGYKHDPYFRCPHDDASYLSGRCVCNEFQGHNADLQPYSCLPKWWYHAGKQFMFNFTNVGTMMD